MERPRKYDFVNKKTSKQADVGQTDPDSATTSRQRIQHPQIRHTPHLCECANFHPWRDSRLGTHHKQMLNGTLHRVDIPPVEPDGAVPALGQHFLSAGRMFAADSGRRSARRTVS